MSHPGVHSSSTSEVKHSLCYLGRGKDFRPPVADWVCVDTDGVGEVGPA